MVRTRMPGGVGGVVLRGAPLSRFDAYESHYATSLQRLRLERYNELHERCESEYQLNLPITDTTHDPF